MSKVIAVDVGGTFTDVVAVADGGSYHPRSRPSAINTETVFLSGAR